MTEQLEKKVHWGEVEAGWREGRLINATFSFSVTKFIDFHSVFLFLLDFPLYFIQKVLKYFLFFFYFSLTIKLSGKIGQTSSYL